MIGNDQILSRAEAFLQDCGALRCLVCNYDLRGQNGRTRRCPECGSLNDILPIHAKVVREAYPVSDGLILAYSLSALPLLGVILGIGTAGKPGTTTLVWTAWIGIAMASWIGMGLICGALCRFERGWLSAFLMMSVVAFEMMFHFAIVFSFMIAVGLWIDGGPFWPTAFMGLVSLLHILARTKLGEPLWRSHAPEAKGRLRTIQLALDERRGINRRWLQLK